MRRWHFTLTCFVLILILSPAKYSKASDEANIAFLGRMTTHDPHRVQSNFELDLLLMIYEPIFRLDPYLKIEKTFASVELSRDALMITIKVDNTIKFHDGDELTAHDIKASLDRVISGPSSLTRYLHGISVVNVVDDHTLSISFDRPNPKALYGLTRVGVVKRRTIIESGDDISSSVPNGTGPFKFVEHQPGAFIRLERNDEHWSSDINMQPEYVNFIFVPKVSAAVQGFEGRRFDFIYPASPKVVQLIQRNLVDYSSPVQGYGAEEPLRLYFSTGDVFRTYYPWITRASRKIPIGLSGTFVHQSSPLARSGTDEVWVETLEDDGAEQPTIEDLLNLDGLAQAGIKKVCGDKCPESCNNSCTTDENGKKCCSVASMPREIIGDLLKD